MHSWFDLNIDNPYASTEEFKDLRTLTNLSQLVIKRWLQNRRSKLRKTGEMQLENNNLTKENRIHLSKYFNRKHQNPSDEDVGLIAKSFKCRPKTIENWFKMQRKLHTKKKEIRQRMCPLHSN